MGYNGTDFPALDRASQLSTWARAWQFYTGNPPRPLTPRKGEPDDNLILSFGRLLVNKGVSYLFGQEVASEISDKDSTNGPHSAKRVSGVTQAWLDECWRRNRRTLFLQKLAVNGGITGHAFAKIVAASTPAQGNFPRVIVLDTQLVDVIWSDNDYEDVIQYTITNPPVAETQTRQLVQKLQDGSWSLVDQQRIGTDQDNEWETVATTPWPWDFPPIVECQNLPAPNQFWGESDLTDDVLHILRAINRQASQINKIIRVHAYPKTWSRGMGAKTVNIGIDEIINLPSATAELHNLEMQSDLASSINFLEGLISKLCFITAVPKVAFGDPDGLGAVSGVSMQLRFAPLVEKTEGKRLTYGALIQELDRRLCALGGWGEHILTQQHWFELLPNDPLMERQYLVLDDSLGVSTETILEKLGYDPKLEAKRKAAEKAANPPPPQLSLVPGQPPQAGAPGDVPPPTPLQAPAPDIAKTAKSR